MIISYPIIIRDDAGNLVSGATVTIASVTTKNGAAIDTPGATVNIAGSNVTVDYDAEVKGEAWITLAVSKNGSTITGENASPALFAARDSSRIQTGILDKVPGTIGGVATLDSNLRVKAAVELIAADVITAQALSDAAINKIQNGLATGADATIIKNYVDTLEASATAIQTALAGLAVTDGNISAALGNVQTAVGALQTAVGTVQGYTDTLEGGVATLQTTATTVAGYTDTVESGIGILQGYTDTVEGGITALQSTASTIQGYVDTVETALAELKTLVENLEIPSGGGGDGGTGTIDVTALAEAITVALLNKPDSVDTGLTLGDLFYALGGVFGGDTDEATSQNPKIYNFANTKVIANITIDNDGNRKIVWDLTR